MNRKDKIVSAVGAALAAGANGGGVAVANAQQTPPPPPAPESVRPQHRDTGALPLSLNWREPFLMSEQK